MQEALDAEDELQLALAKEASLAPPLHGHAESLSFKYWSTGRQMAIWSLGLLKTLHCLKAEAPHSCCGRYKLLLQQPHTSHPDDVSGMHAGSTSKTGFRIAFMQFTAVIRRT